MHPGDAGFASPRTQRAGSRSPLPRLPSASGLIETELLPRLAKCPFCCPAPHQPGQPDACRRHPLRAAGIVPNGSSELSARGAWRQPIADLRQQADHAALSLRHRSPRQNHQPPEHQEGQPSHDQTGQVFRAHADVPNYCGTTFAGTAQGCPTLHPCQDGHPGSVGQPSTVLISAQARRRHSLQRLPPVPRPGLRVRRGVRLRRRLTASSW